MKIGGLLRTSLIDFPKKISAVVFTQGCSFRCPFCHNPSLVLSEQFGPSLSAEEVLLFLSKRKKQLDGVVISGGEPTLQEGLDPFIQEIKKLGLAVKLDTSGANPDVLEHLLKQDLLDYVAMDIKAPLDKYEIATGSKKTDPAKILKSIRLLLNSSIDYEFRSTLLPLLHSKEDILSMAKLISGARLYVLQSFLPKITLNKDYEKAKRYTQEELEEFSKMVLPYVKECKVR